MRDDHVINRIHAVEPDLGRGARISHAVCFVDDLEPRRRFYERVLGRKFKGGSSAVRCECWFIAMRQHDYELPGWNVYFAADTLAPIVSALDGAVVRTAMTDDVEFAFVTDPVLGSFVLQQGGGGDASARFSTSDSTVALARLDRALHIYAERGETSFATTSGAYLEVPSLVQPNWSPVWRTEKLEAVLARAMKHGAKMLSVDESMGVSARIADPWGAELVVADDDEIEHDMPDLASVQDAERYFAGESERAQKAWNARAARVAALRAKWM